MKYLIFLVILSSCGKPLVQVPEKVTVEHTVNISSVEPYIKAFCETQFSEPSDVNNCVNLEIGKLINKL